MTHSSVSRIRGRRLQRIRAAHLRANPLCVHCTAKGRVAGATEVDHIVALVNGGEDIEENRQGLCRECHRIKTAADLGHAARRTTGADGWPVE
jgi:5-methylcytosine-specific restriction protein A